MAKAKAKKKDDLPALRVEGIDEVVTELKAVKRLLSLMLLKCGATKYEVAKTAGVRLSTITQMGGAAGLLLRDVNGKKE